jgi:hypothetical protein
MHYMHHEGSFQQARPFSVELLPNEPGEFTFARPMGMFRGRLIVDRARIQRGRQIHHQKGLGPHTRRSAGMSALWSVADITAAHRVGCFVPQVDIHPSGVGSYDNDHQRSEASDRSVGFLVVGLPRFSGCLCMLWW